MNNYMTNFTANAENTIQNLIASIDLTDPLKLILFLIDVISVILIIYYIAKLVKDTRAKQIVKGIAIFIAVTLISEWLHLVVLNYILRTIMTYGVLLLIIVFQPELRSALEKIGRRKNLKKVIGSDDTSIKYVISEVLSAVESMSKNKVGALIVIEKEIRLEDIIREGIELNAKVSSQLLNNIFIPNSPLHDGAVIIEGTKIRAARCVLPLASEEVYDRSLGTRHRAAIGITEISDAIAVVVSEETSSISIVYEGKIQKGISISDLKQKLNNKLK